MGQGVGSDDIVGLEGSIPLEGHGRGDMEEELVLRMRGELGPQVLRV